MIFPDCLKIKSVTFAIMPFLSSQIIFSIAFAIVFGAFAANTLHGALNAVPKNQLETARAYGMNDRQTFWRVHMPQMWVYALPGLSNLWLVLLKDTALVSIIALPDLLRMTQVAVGNTKEPFFFFLVACLIYLGLAIVSSIGIGGIDRWTKRGEDRI